MSARVHRWEELEADSPMAKLTRRRVIGEHAMLSHITLERGFFLAAHAHANEQFACVLSGRMRFTLTEPGGERIVEVGPGEVLYIPPHMPHAAEAVETSVIIDVFSPPSETTGVDAGDE